MELAGLPEIIQPDDVGKSEEINNECIQDEVLKQMGSKRIASKNAQAKIRLLVGDEDN